VITLVTVTAIGAVLVIMGMVGLTFFALPALRDGRPALGTVIAVSAIVEICLGVLVLYTLIVEGS
jgi:uncharacterized membrane protein